LAANDPAIKAARAARLIGIILLIFGLLVLIVVAIMFAQPGPIALKLFSLATSLVYLAPSVAFIWLSGPVRRAGRASTIATMILAIVLSLLMLLGLVAQILGAIAGGTTQAPNFIGIVIAFLLSLAAAMLAVYCIQSLRFPDRIDPVRGFEPLMTAIPVEPAASEVERQP
jgi:Na+/proline symporter